MNILTIDIGGTEIKSAIYDEHSQLVIDFKNQTTEITNNDNNIVGQVLTITKKAITQAGICGVAISTAGIVDVENGCIIYANDNIPRYRGTNFSILIKEKFGLPCIVENDVNAMAMAEFSLTDGISSAFCITIGTGLGGAIIMNNKLWYGKGFSAGEIGNIPIIDQLENYYQISGKNVNGKVFFQNLHNGDTFAQQAFNTMIQTLARGLCPIIYLFSPDALIIGGGISKQGNIISDAIRNALQEMVTDEYFLPSQITTAQLGNRAGMLGALKIFLQQYNHTSK